MTRRVFISGGTGYLGANYLINRIKLGDSVTLLCRKNSNFTLLKHVANGREWRSKTRIVYVDMSEKLVEAIVKDNADEFVHFAAKGRYHTEASEIAQLVDANVTLGSLMLEGVKRVTKVTGRRRPLVFCGSYWQHSGKTKEYAPNSFYAATKSAFEEIARYYKQTLELPVIGLKLYDIYGPRDLRERLIDLIISAIKKGQPLALSGGEQKIRLLHVNDAADAINHALKSVMTDPSALSYGIYGDDAPTIRDIAAYLEKQSSKEANIEWGGRSYREFEIFDPYLLERLPGWSPQVTYKDGLSEILTDDSKNT